MSAKQQAPQDFDPGMMDEEESNVTPEEQKQYDTVVGKAMELLYDEERLGYLVDKLKGGAKNISKEIGHSAAMTLSTIDQTVKEQGQQIPEEILFNAGEEIVSQIVDIAVAAGIVSPEQEQDVAEAALYEGLRVWGQNMGRDGKITPERSSEAQEALSMAQIQQDATKASALKQGPGAQEQTPPGQAAQQSGPPAPQAAPAQGGIINQAGA